jgi:putative transposase
MPIGFRRKNIRLHPTRYQGREWFFITICCEDRWRVFAEGARAQLLIDLLRSTAGKFHFAVHAYCVMPDHFHALVEGVAAESNLLSFVRNFKQMSSREYSRATGQQLWQKKFYDHVLRVGDSPDAVSWYIWMNPVRKGICATAFEYPLSGSFTKAWREIIQPTETWVPAWEKWQVACP